MRACIGSRMNERLDSNYRTSKDNYGSRKGHSIENVLLEMIFVMDHEKKGEENVCAMSDLEACYDRQTPELCGLVEGSIGANRKAVKLLTKVFPKLDHHVGAVNRVSKEKYGGSKGLLGGTGQGSICW